MKKIIILLFFPFLGFGQNCQYNEVVLQLTTGTWASEVSWSITDSIGNLIDSTSQTYADSTTYYDTICLPNGCYNFNMYDTYGDGWQGGSYQLVDSLGVLISSGNLQGSFSFGTNLFNLNSPFCSTECQFNEVVLQLNTGDWASEVSWSITDSIGNLIDSTSQTYADSTTYYDTICLPNGCYNFNMYDTYGNGWQGGSFYILDSNNTIVCNGDLQGSFSFDFVPFCVPLIPPPPCYDNLLTLQLTTGIWASEVSWSVTDSAGNVIDSTNQLYQDNTLYLVDICVPNGCYDFNMFDTYGDGWQGGSYILVDSLSNVISSGNLQGSYTFGSNIFSINSTACPVLGCTLPFAVNYNPSATIDDTSCTFLNDNVNLLYHWSDSTLPINGLGGSYTDVYGVAINGGEYAVIGSTMGTHIIDVTNPTQCYEAAFVPGAQQFSVTHRDYFSMDNYLYGVCDQGTSTLQIIDLTNLPNSVSLVYNSNSLISTSHNMFIDIINKKLYSTNGDVLDISNPTQPTFLFNMGFSCHDLYVENDTGYFNCTSNGLQIYEMSTNNPVYIGSLTSYPQQGTNHSGWKKDNTYVLADENHGLSLKVIDVSDLSNMSVIALFNSGVDANSIAHNLIIRDNFVYVSYYHDGLQIFDISDPNNPIKAGYYDTYLPDNHNGFAGNWGVDPLLPSGIILASDVQSGLFVLEFDYNPQSICEGDSLLFDTSYLNTDGFYISNTLDTLGYSDIIVIELSTVPTASSTQSISIANGDSILLGGMYRTTAGIFIDTLVNQFGCDSIINTTLSILPTTINEDYLQKKLIKIVDFLGRKTPFKENKTLFYIFDDGTVEKKILIK
ncbi:MAG TPA: choice-of-anchor B family protein [Flavobacteriales bacterium]|nr:choice-of-anchor B family protein [Flavobacteriales bacterium]